MREVTQDPPPAAGTSCKQKKTGRRGTSVLSFHPIQHLTTVEGRVLGSEDAGRIDIGTGLQFRAVHLQRYDLERMGTRRGMLPATEWNSGRICSLPLFPEMTEADVDGVVAAIQDAIRGGR
jgi:dTDP-4-amino-4,6-dideoxygalactose transaminase